MKKCKKKYPKTQKHPRKHLWDYFLRFGAFLALFGTFFLDFSTLFVAFSPKFPLFRGDLIQGDLSKNSKI